MSGKEEHMRYTPTECEDGDPEVVEYACHPSSDEVKGCDPIWEIV